MLGNSNTLEDATTVSRDFIQLIVARLDLPSLEALKQAVNTERDLMLGVSAIAKVDLGNILAPPKLVVGYLDMLLTGNVP